jgi:uncharacterized protein YjbJ (UPF0337 family)
MNKDQVKGAAKEVAGRAQASLGRAVDSPKHQAKGIAKQVEGRAQKNLGDAREVLKDSLDSPPRSDR